MPLIVISESLGFGSRVETLESKFVEVAPGSIAEGTAVQNLSGSYPQSVRQTAVLAGIDTEKADWKRIVLGTGVGKAAAAGKIAAGRVVAGKTAAGRRAKLLLSCACPCL